MDNILTDYPYELNNKIYDSVTDLIKITNEIKDHTKNDPRFAKHFENEKKRECDIEEFYNFLEYISLRFWDISHEIDVAIGTYRAKREIELFRRAIETDPGLKEEFLRSPWRVKQIIYSHEHYLKKH